MRDCLQGRFEESQDIFLEFWVNPEKLRLIFGHACWMGVEEEFHVIERKYC